MVEIAVRLLGPTYVCPQIGPLSFVNLTLTAMLQLFTIQRVPDSLSVRVHCDTPLTKRDEELAVFGAGVASGGVLVVLAVPVSVGSDDELLAVASLLPAPHPGGIADAGGAPDIPAPNAAMNPDTPRAQGS